MKFTTERKALLDAVRILEPITRGRKTLPIQGFIKIVAKDGLLWLYATNLEMYVSLPIGARLVKAGSACLEAGPLLKLLQALDEEKLLISVEEPKGEHQHGTATIETDRTHSTAITMDPADFPPYPTVKGTPVVIKDLAERLGRVAVAAARDDARPVLTSICFSGLNKTVRAALTQYGASVAGSAETARQLKKAARAAYDEAIKDKPRHLDNPFRPNPDFPADAGKNRQDAEMAADAACSKASAEAAKERDAAIAKARGPLELDVVAADGFRLGVAHCKTAGPVFKGQINVPLDTCLYLMANTKDAAGVTMTVANPDEHGVTRYASFQCGGLVVTTALIQGNFPNHQMLIPNNATQHLRFDAADALRGLKVLAPIAKDGSGIIRIEAKGDNKLVTLMAKAEERGSTTVKLKGTGMGKIAFNMQYLRDALALMEGPVQLDITDPSSPGMIKQKDSLMVVMPMFVQW